jgi:hypothetical protein
MSAYWHYYREAFERSWTNGWDSAIGQGIWLTLWLAISITVFYFVSARLVKRDTRISGHLRQAAGEWIISTVGGVAVLTTVLFAAFFIMDAPDQAARAKVKMDAAEADFSNRIGELKNESKTAVDNLNSQIGYLRSQLDDRERKKNIRIALGRFAMDGSVLLARPTTTDADADAWERRIKAFLLSDLDESTGGDWFWASSSWFETRWAEPAGGG